MPQTTPYNCQCSAPRIQFNGMHRNELLHLWKMIKNDKQRPKMANSELVGRYNNAQVFWRVTLCYIQFWAKLLRRKTFSVKIRCICDMPVVCCLQRTYASDARTLLCIFFCFQMKRSQMFNPLRWSELKWLIIFRTASSGAFSWGSSIWNEFIAFGLSLSDQYASDARFPT